MKTLLFTLLLFIGCNKSIDQPRPNLAMENHLAEEGYNIYKAVVGQDTTYYCNANTLLSFNTTFGEQSLNIYDLNSDQIVTTADLTTLLTGYGVECPYYFNLYECQIFGQFSSGWFMDHPDWNAIFLKPTPVDEVNNSIAPDELRSFFIEGIKQDTLHKYWYYKK